MTDLEHHSPKLRVCVSGNGKGVFLVAALARLLVNPTFIGLAGADGYRAAILAQPLKEAELTYDDCFSRKQTRIHVFVFLSCPIPF